MANIGKPVREEPLQVPAPWKMPEPVKEPSPNVTPAPAEPATTPAEPEKVPS